MKEKRTPAQHNTDKHLDFKSKPSGDKKLTLKNTTISGGMKVRQSPQEHR